MKNVTQPSVPFPHSKIPSLLNHSAVGVIARRSLVVALISLAVVTSTPGARAQNANTAYGTNALRSLTTGSYNSAFGDSALFNNTTGTYNTAVGTSALYRNIAGERNTAVGAGALAYTRAGDNTGIGWQALVNSSTGTQNTAIGSGALEGGGFGNTGSYNTATGFQAMHYNVDGGGNVADGWQALYSNHSGIYNTASGTQALYSNTTGNSNTALGAGALQSNQTGGQNTAIGNSALLFNLGGSNTATGVDSLHSNNSGNSNVADGWQTLYSNTSGVNNAATGTQALYYNTSGFNNVALGYQAGLNLTSGSNNIVIGAGVLGTAGEANTTRIGKTTQKKTFIGGISGKTVASGVGVIVNSQGQLGTIQSSARFKDDIKPMDQASEALLKLKPVTFRYKEELDPDKIPQFGLIAEQVENINPDLVVHDEDGKINTVRYEAVNAMLLNEFLKEHRKVEELKMMLAKQESRDLVQQEQINALKAGLQRVCKQNRTGQTSVTPKQ